jgi:hypothetical protein
VLALRCSKMRRYVSNQLQRRREAAIAAQLEDAIPEAKPVPRNLARELAEQIIKMVRGNPVMASSAEYDRIVNLISQYTLAIKEQA